MAAGDLTDLTTAQLAANVPLSAQPDTLQVLQTLISAISAYVPSIIGCNILSASYTDFYTGNGKDSMLLRQRPVTAISSISWQGNTIATIGDPIAGTTGFWTDGRAAKLVNFCFPLGMPIQIAYTAGYASVPLDVKLAVAELVAEAYQRRTHVGENSKSQGGQVTVAFDPKTMHNSIADKLQGYVVGAPC